MTNKAQSETQKCCQFQEEYIWMGFTSTCSDPPWHWTSFVQQLHEAQAHPSRAAKWNANTLFLFIKKISQIVFCWLGGNQKYPKYVRGGSIIFFKTTVLASPPWCILWCLIVSPGLSQHARNAVAIIWPWHNLNSPSRMKCPHHTSQLKNQMNVHKVFNTMWTLTWYPCIMLAGPTPLVTC